MSAHPTRQWLVLGSLRIDLAQGIVESGDGSSGLTPRAESLLLLLCRNAGKLVTREEIHDSVWAGRVVEDAAITNTIWQIRRALGEEGKDLLQTRAKRGYLLTVPQGAWRQDAVASETVPAEAGEPLAHAGPEDAPASSFAASEIAETPERPAVALVHAPAKRWRRWMPAVAGFALAAVAGYGMHLWRARQEAPAQVARMTLTPDAELTVSVQVPEKLDWVRNAVLRVAVEQAYLRESEMLYFEKRQKRNPFLGPHLQVDAHATGDKTVVAELSLTQGRKVLRREFEGQAQDLADATATFLAGSLQPPKKQATAASDAFVSGMVADALYDQIMAVAEFRRALERDPKMTDAKLALTERLFGMGRTREAVAILEQLLPDPGLSSSQRCRLDELTVFMAPDRLGPKLCKRARVQSELQEWDARGALREIGVQKAGTQSATDWQIYEQARITAHLLAKEWPQAESTIAATQALADEAGWESARIRFGASRALIGSFRGEIEEMLRHNRKTAAEYAAIGDVSGALQYQVRVVKALPVVPGPKVAKQRDELSVIIDRARANGDVAIEIEALTALLALDLDHPARWRAGEARIRALVEETYTPASQAEELYLLHRQSLSLRQYRDYLARLKTLAARFESSNAQTNAWVPVLQLEAMFLLDDRQAVEVAFRKLEQQPLDLSSGFACYFAWVRAVFGQPQRAREALGQCPYADFDRVTMAARGDQGLMAQAWLYRLQGEPQRAWSVLQPRIDALLAMPEMTRKEGESLAFFARHAAAMPGADLARLRRAQRVVAEMAGKDGAGPPLRFGAYALDWRLCMVEGREDCGPVLPEWAQEDLLEARLATESLRTSQSRQ